MELAARSALHALFVCFSKALGVIVIGNVIIHEFVNLSQTHTRAYRKMSHTHTHTRRDRGIRDRGVREVRLIRNGDCSPGIPKSYHWGSLRSSNHKNKGRSKRPFLEEVIEDVTAIKTTKHSRWNTSLIHQRGRLGHLPRDDVLSWLRPTSRSARGRLTQAPARPIPNGGRMVSQSRATSVRTAHAQGRLVPEQAAPAPTDQAA